MGKAYELATPIGLYRLLETLSKWFRHPPGRFEDLDGNPSGDVKV